MRLERRSPAGIIPGRSPTGNDHPLVGPGAADGVGVAGDDDHRRVTNADRQRGMVDDRLCVAVQGGAVFGEQDLAYRVSHRQLPGGIARGNAAAADQGIGPHAGAGGWDGSGAVRRVVGRAGANDAKHAAHQKQGDEQGQAHGPSGLLLVCRISDDNGTTTAPPAAATWSHRIAHRPVTFPLGRRGHRIPTPQTPPQISQDRL